VFLPVVMRRKLSFEMPHKNTYADRISDLQKQMGMIRSKTVIQHHYLESPHRFPKPLAIFIAGNIKNHNVSQDAALFRLEAKFDAHF
jgi:hypothetical protein